MPTSRSIMRTVLSVFAAADDTSRLTDTLHMENFTIPRLFALTNPAKGDVSGDSRGHW